MASDAGFLSSLLSGLKDLSPIIAGLLIIGLIIDRVLKFLAQGRRDTTLQDMTAKLAELSAHTDSLSASQSRFRDQLAAQEKTRMEHAHTQEMLFREMLRTMDRAVKELISLKALQGSQTMAMEESKLLIAYQWSWCRDEVVRIIINSISNNHFKGNEERVARSVHRAWLGAASNARESISRFPSLKYPYEQLFEVVLQLLLDRVWKEAVPIYHADRSMTQYVSKIELLREEVKAWFDEGLEAYFEQMEDVDSGALYRAVPEQVVDDSQTHYKAQLLSAYKVGGRSPISGEFDIRAEIAKRSQDIMSKTPSVQFPAVKRPS